MNLFLLHADELWDGEMRALALGSRRILLLRIGDEVRAYNNRCPHQGRTFDSEALEAGVITCPAHRWQFDALSGQGINPKKVCLERLALRRVGQAIYLDVETRGECYVES